MSQVTKPGPRSKRGVGRQGSKALGSLIKGRRAMLGLSQDEFAREMGWSSRGTVSPIESGSRALTAEDKVQQVADFLGISPDEIYTIQGYVPHDIYDAVSQFNPAQMERLRQFIRSET